MSLIDLADFYLNFKGFIEISYNFLTFKRLVKMYQYYNQILKYSMLTPWVRSSIHWMRHIPLSHVHFLLIYREINITLVAGRLS